MYRIAQLTDIHIGDDGEETFEVDVRDNFRRTLAQAIRDGVDEVLITGDLAYRSGNPDIYAWIARELATCEVPYWVLPGNHDDVPMMKAAFGNRAYAEQLHVRSVAKRDLVFVDSGLSRVSEPQLAALETALKKTRRAPLVFIHHPPVPLGVPYMDDGHMLENHARLVEVFQTRVHHVHVFCGHYHVERTVHAGALTVHATPSTFFQIDPRHESFVVDHRTPGYRAIAFDDESLQTAVHWVPPFA